MDQLGQIRIALKVAELGSFAAAARALKLSTGAVSQSVARLEGQLGLRVFERNTRQVRQTVQGEQLLDRLRPLVRAMDGVLEPGLSRQPVRGVLTVELSESFANAVVIPRLPQFMARHPALSLIIHLSERATNLSREPIDVALRTVEPIEPAARYRRLRAFALVPVAAPDYLARAGTPQHPLDLLQHQRIDFLTPYDRKAWPAYFYRDGEEIEIPPQGRIALDNSQACLALARQGMGIYADYALQLKDDLASGRLQRILPDWDMLSWPLFAVYKTKARRRPPCAPFWISWRTAATRCMRTFQPPASRAKRRCPLFPAGWPDQNLASARLRPCRMIRARCCSIRRWRDGGWTVRAARTR